MDALVPCAGLCGPRALYYTPRRQTSSVLESGACPPMYAPVREIGSDARVLLVIDQPVLAEYIKLALNHGTYLTRVVPHAAATQAMLTTWRPHLAIVDMDITQGAILE